MRIVYMFIICYHTEKELCTSCQVLSETDCGKQLQPRQNVLAVFILLHQAKALLEPQLNQIG